MSYTEKLKDPRWQRKRLETMQRDDWRCIRCSTSDSTLAVHHIVYSGDPWEAPVDMLQTLCQECHEDLGKHPKGGIGWTSSEAGYPAIEFTVHHCPKCGGNDWRDKGSWDKCKNCGYITQPEVWK